jgi:hypothetical protein
MTLDLEIHQHLGSLKHVINIIMWIRDTGCYIKQDGGSSVARRGLVDRAEDVTDSARVWLGLVDRVEDIVDLARVSGSGQGQRGSDAGRAGTSVP